MSKQEEYEVTKRIGATCRGVSSTGSRIFSLEEEIPWLEDNTMILQPVAGYVPHGNAQSGDHGYVEFRYKKSTYGMWWFVAGEMPSSSSENGS